MIEPSIAESAFARLRSSLEVGVHLDGSFLVERADKSGLRFFARSEVGEPALILATFGRDNLPPLRLAGLRVDYDVDCTVVEDGTRRSITASIISSPVVESTEWDLFSTLCVSLLDVVRLRASSKDVAGAIDRWSRIFWRLSQVVKTDLVGLAGELVCIAVSAHKDAWLQAWHPRPDDRFDFTFHRVRSSVEVKSTTSDRRVHEISLRQITDNNRFSKFFASVRITEGDVSLYDIVREIAGDVHSDSAIVSLWDILASCCGTAIDEALSFGIDFDRARDSVLYYLGENIPRPSVSVPLPIGVSNVRYTVDMDNCESVNLSVVESVCLSRGDPS